MTPHDVAAAILLAKTGTAPAAPEIIPPKGDESGDLADYERDVVNALQQHREWRARWKEAQVKTVEWAFDVLECQERLAAAKERGVR